MDIKEILKRYGGKEIDIDSLPQYQRWALNYFSTDRTMVDPNVYITVQLDITEAHANYKKHFASTAGASFTAYMIWRIVQTMNDIEPFNYRYLRGRWYHLADAPVLVPIATGKENRFREVLLEKTGKKTWENFAGEYRFELNEALDGRGIASGSHGENVFDICSVMFNLPNIQFTSYEHNLHLTQTGRCFWSMGKRYEMGGKYLMPFAVSLNHSNLDPYMLDIFIQKLNQKLVLTN